MPVFDNCAVKKITIQKEFCSINIFRPHLRSLLPIINLKSSDLVDFESGLTKDKFLIEETLGSQLNLIEYFRLRHIGNCILNFHNNSNHISVGDPKEFHKIFFSKTKGSKKYRKAVPYRLPSNLLSNRIQKLNIMEEPVFKHFSEYFNKVVGLSFLSHNVKYTLFKYLSNSLGTYDRVGHFNPDIDERCNFCKIIPYVIAARETPSHLFMHCPALAHIREFFFNITHCPRSDDITIAVGSNSTTSFVNLFDNVVTAIYIHFIYSNRSSCKIPTLGAFREYLLSTINNSVQISRFFGNIVSRVQKTSLDQLIQSIIVPFL